MDRIFDIKFSYEKEMRDKVIKIFSEKQGGQSSFSVFSQYWQCFAWAAAVGYLRCDPKPLTGALADKAFNLNTMINNNGEKDAKALLCMCIAKAGTLDILKDPEAAIAQINEYANAGLHYIFDEMQDKPVNNDSLWVKEEILSR